MSVFAYLKLDCNSKFIWKFKAQEKLREYFMRVYWQFSDFHPSWIFKCKNSFYIVKRLTFSVRIQRREKTYFSKVVVTKYKIHIWWRFNKKKTIRNESTYLVIKMSVYTFQKHVVIYDDGIIINHEHYEFSFHKIMYVVMFETMKNHPKPWIKLLCVLGSVCMYYPF